MKKSFIIFLLSLFAIYAFAQKTKIRNIDNIEIGMTFSEVKLLVGSPTLRNADKEEEYWIYNYIRSLERRTTIITFKQGKVMAFETMLTNDYDHIRQKGLPQQPQSYPQDLPQQFPIVVPSAQHPYISYIAPLSNDAFQQLKKYYDSEVWEDGKMKILKVAALGCFFTCEQCCHFMKSKTWDDDKLAIAEILVPRIIDLQNVSSLYALLRFQDSHHKLDSIIKRCLLKR